MAESENPSMNWASPDFVKEFNRFRQHCQFTFDGPLAAKTELEKVNYLMTYIGDRGRKIFSTFQWTPGTPAAGGNPAVPAENEILSGVLSKFETYVAPKRNVIKATLEFNKRSQGTTESFSTFLTDLRVLVKRCDYQDEERMLRDAIILRKRDQKVREKCLDLGDELTLDKAINLALNYETSQASLVAMDRSESVSAINKGRRIVKGQPKGQQGQSRQLKCGRCGTNHQYESCPAYGTICSKCKGRNHWASYCRSRPRSSFKSRATKGSKKVNELLQSDSDEDEFLVDVNILSLNSSLGCMPMKHNIHIDKSVTPVQNACRKVPFKLRDKVEKELKRMTDLGVIEKITQPTEWVNNMVTVAKKNGDIRLCLDPRDLNNAIQREHFKLPSREDIMAEFANAKIFSKLDAASGFWQIPLDDKRAKLTCFITPFGRYIYKRLPFGLNMAPEAYHKRIHELFECIPGVNTMMNDIIVWGTTREEHDARLERPDPRKVSAIENMPRPENKQELQRFLGMVTFRAKFVPDLSSITAPLRNLTKDQNEWMWEESQENAWI
ncbi:uncharacterized protein LOC117108748 [Anneissia japonica]|uniref:uncharacterized protein LOC117108748 n=1 Tax=Anneissia japonica TaxID=1529436 RepID=UPI0014255827|nr:uncharacterized protein LOC117108748 [Anneissia japonica]